MQKIKQSLDTPSTSLTHKPEAKISDDDKQLGSKIQSVPRAESNPLSADCQMTSIVQTTDEESRRPSLYSAVQGNVNVREDEMHQREQSLMKYIKEQDSMLVAMKGRLEGLMAPAQNNITQTGHLLTALRVVSDKMHKLEEESDLLYAQLKQQQTLVRDRDFEICQLKAQIKRLQLNEFDKISFEVSGKVRQQMTESANIREKLIKAVQPSVCEACDFDQLQDATEQMLQGVVIQQQLSHEFDVKCLENNIKIQLGSIGMTLERN